MENIAQKVREGDARALSRLISLSEDKHPAARTILNSLFPDSKRAWTIGITGPPGAGKSTLVDSLALDLLARGNKVAILAIDPSSPFSGGAVLGDRIRMTEASEREEIFVRSMATRGELGGLSSAIEEALLALECAGFDVVLIETVGVGQAEIDIVKLADSCAVILVPGLGDSVQALKAGVLEIADLFILNKSDKPGVDALERDVRLLLGLKEWIKEEWEPPIVRTIATERKGASEVVDDLTKHRGWLDSSAIGADTKRAHMRSRVLRGVLRAISDEILQERSPELSKLVSRCMQRELPVHTAAEVLGESLKARKNS